MRYQVLPVVRGSFLLAMCDYEWLNYGIPPPRKRKCDILLNILLDAVSSILFQLLEGYGYFLGFQ